MRVNFYIVFVIFLLVLLGFVGHGQAAMMNSKTLLALCGGKQEKETFVCDAYISGVLDYQNLLHNLKTTPALAFCLPEDIKIERLRQDIASYLSQNKQHNSFSAAAAVTLALNKTYPCR